VSKYAAVLLISVALAACAASNSSLTPGLTSASERAATALPSTLSQTADAPKTAASSAAAAAAQEVEAGAARSPESSGAAHKGVKVTQVLNVEDYAQHVICRREAPLGTRIAHRHCVAQGEEEPNAAQEYLQQQEFERLREQQAYMELARQEALRQSVQRR
jgi:hypothetical protein